PCGWRPRFDRPSPRLQSSWGACRHQTARSSPSPLLVTQGYRDVRTRKARRGSGAEPGCREPSDVEEAAHGEQARRRRHDATPSRKTAVTAFSRTKYWLWSTMLSMPGWPPSLAATTLN